MQNYSIKSPKELFSNIIFRGDYIAIVTKNTRQKLNSESVRYKDINSGALKSHNLNTSFQKSNDIVATPPMIYIL